MIEMLSLKALHFSDQACPLNHTSSSILKLSLGAGLLSCSLSIFPMTPTCHTGLFNTICLFCFLLSWVSCSFLLEPTSVPKAFTCFLLALSSFIGLGEASSLNVVSTCFCVWRFLRPSRNLLFSPLSSSLFLCTVHCYLDIIVTSLF